MNAFILGLSTIVPPHVFTQEAIAQKMIDIFQIEGEKAQQLRHLYQNSAILKRHSVIPDFLKERKEWSFWGSDYPCSQPGMTERNEIYKQEAPKLAREAAKKAIFNWGGHPQHITHVISVSCTGVLAPGLEFDLISHLNLNRCVNRLGINFMGCFGAFKGLSVAQSLAKENQEHRILLVCTELCSLHLQSQLTPDNILGNSLFSDGAAAVVVGKNPLPNEKPLWEICRNTSMGLDNTVDKMTWEASDLGFLMTLSPHVPVLIGRHIQAFSQTLLEEKINSSECDWAIHPGGKSIVQAIEKAMKLEKEQTSASWHTLAQYGNMSSATFLFVLEQLFKQKSPRQWALGVGFGPGLSFEGILLRRQSHAQT